MGLSFDNGSLIMVFYVFPKNPYYQLPGLIEML